MKLYARQQGKGADLISIHGLFGSQENLGAINRQLAEEFLVHGVDVRNHGRSPHSDEMNYELMAGDIIEYMDNQGIEKAHILGHSMGGKIAMKAALDYPDRVEKLVVMDIAPVQYKVRRHDDVFAGLHAVNLEQLAKRSDADKVISEYVQEAAVRSFLLKNLYRNEQGSYGWRMNLQALHEHYLEILDGQSADGAFSGETLFLKGGDSDYILPEHREEVLRHFPKASLREIANTAHWLHAEKPDLVARTLKRFFLN